LLSWLILSVDVGILSIPKMLHNWRLIGQPGKRFERLDVQQDRHGLAVLRDDDLLYIVLTKRLKA
jgi:hypothetical protein